MRSAPYASKWINRVEEGTGYIIRMAELLALSGLFRFLANIGDFGPAEIMRFFFDVSAIVYLIVHMVSKTDFVDFHSKLSQSHKKFDRIKLWTVNVGLLVFGSFISYMFGYMGEIVSSATFTDPFKSS